MKTYNTTCHKCGSYQTKLVQNESDKFSLILLFIILLKYTISIELRNLSGNSCFNCCFAIFNITRRYSNQEGNFDKITRAIALAVNEPIRSLVE